MEIKTTVVLVFGLIIFFCRIGNTTPRFITNPAYSQQPKWLYFVFLMMRIKNLLRIGVFEGMDIEAQRTLAFSNAAYFLVGSLMVLYSGLRLAVQGPSGFATPAAWIPVGISATAVLCVFLNSSQYYLTSRVVFVISWILLALLGPPVLAGTRPTSYFTYAYLAIFFSPIVQLFFSFDKERFFYFLFTLVFFLFVVFSVDILLLFDSRPDAGVPLVKTTIGMRVNYLVYWAFINILIFYVLRINRQYYYKLKEKNELIHQQNEELAAQQELLQNHNAELEKHVTQRTLVLKEQNNRLTEYAFMNAHILRAPISRIRGLINLFEVTNDPCEGAKIRELISTQMKELDEAVSSIGKKLDELPIDSQARLSDK